MHGYTMSLKTWIKAQKTPLAKCLYTTIKTLLIMSLPSPKWLFGPLLHLHRLISTGFQLLMRFTYWTPLAKQVFIKPPRHLNYQYNGLPFVQGSVAINIGEHCSLSQVDFTGTCRLREDGSKPTITIGNHSGIGHLSVLSTGSMITIGDHCDIAERCYFLGSPGHPLNPEKRRQGMPPEAHQFKDIILEDNVWLGSTCIIIGGVTIGKNSVIGTGSIVTKDIPANVLAAGNPAKVICVLNEKP